MNNIIHITRPELTAAERARRMEEIKQATINLAIAMERSRLLKERKKP